MFLQKGKSIMKRLKKLIAGALAAAVSAVCMMPLASGAVGSGYPDPNGDGSLDLADATYIIQYLAGRFEPEDLSELDVDRNGVISQMDVYCVQLKEAGLWEAKNG